MFKVDNKNSGIKTLFFATVFNRGQCFLKGKSFFIALEERLHALQKYNVFDSYFYLRHILIQKEHLQPYIWVAPLLFQEAICSYLGFFWNKHL